MFGPYGDRPGSISDAEKEFAKKIVEQYDISRTAALFGAVVYGNNANIAWKLGDATNLKSTISRIDLLKRPRDGNDILGSLLVARDKLFSKANGGRVNVPKTLFLFVRKTDGKDTRVEDAARDLKEKGIGIVVIASGREVSKKDLAGIASDPSKLIVSNDLSNTVENVSLIAGSKSLPGIGCFFPFDRIVPLLT